MKSKITTVFFLIFLFLFLTQKSNSQSFTSAKLNSDSLLFDGAERNFYSVERCNGKVTNIKGCAKIIHPSGECGVPGTESNVSVGSSAVQGDIVKVCPKSMVEITLSDGSVMRGAPDSEINMSELNCDGGRSFSLRLFLGALWSEVAPVIGGETKYEVKTENAVVGSRGTKYLVKVKYDTLITGGMTDVKITTTVACLEGIVEVSNANGVTITDTSEQLKLVEDFQNGKITAEEFQRRGIEINNNNKRLVEAGMEVNIINGNPPSLPFSAKFTLADFSGENLVK